MERPPIGSTRGIDVDGRSLDVRAAGDLGLLPGARLTWVDDAGHFVPADRPDVVVEAVLRLVERA